MNPITDFSNISKRKKAIKRFKEIMHIIASIKNGNEQGSYYDLLATIFELQVNAIKSRRFK
jgi:hypothetical protein